MKHPGILAAILALQAALLSIGIGADYRLKHEDNNALHATFARSHLTLGPRTTRAQNYFHSPATGAGSFYPHHPPGPGLVLAAAYGVAGSDGPATTRATAILFHVLGTLLFVGLARRILRNDREVTVAALCFVLLPESAFFGRMVNHETLVLPGAILAVRGYWEYLRGSPAAGWWCAASVLGCVWAGAMGWAGFFVMAACMLHAVRALLAGGRRRAAAPLVWLGLSGGVLFVANVALLASVQPGGLAYLGDLLASRAGGDSGHGPAAWLGRVLELHWRYFSLTSVAALGALAWRGGASFLRRPAGGDAAAEVGLIFLAAGAAYVAVFNVAAARHDYWQFLLLPSSAIALTLAWRWLTSTSLRRTRRRTFRTAAAVVAFDLVLTFTVTMGQRHLKEEAYCVETVERLRRDAL